MWLKWYDFVPVMQRCFSLCWNISCWWCIFFPFKGFLGSFLIGNGSMTLMMHRIFNLSRICAYRKLFRHDLPNLHPHRWKEKDSLEGLVESNLKISQNNTKYISLKLLLSHACSSVSSSECSWRTLWRAREASKGRQCLSHQCTSRCGTGVASFTQHAKLNWSLNQTVEEANPLVKTLYSSASP